MVHQLEPYYKKYIHSNAQLRIIGTALSLIDWPNASEGEFYKVHKIKNDDYRNIVQCQIWIEQNPPQDYQIHYNYETGNFSAE